jgi:hypothetical protein
MAKSIEAEVKRLMATGMTEAEARETAEYDLAVENGESTEFDLTEEQKKVAKKYTGTGTKKRTEYQFTKRERKPNETKRHIMSLVRVLFEGLELKGECKGVNLSNIERTLDFEMDDKHYTLTLTEHRPPKTPKA